MGTRLVSNKKLTSLTNFKKISTFCRLQICFKLIKLFFLEVKKIDTLLMLNEIKIYTLKKTFGKLENNYYLQDHEPVALYFNNQIVMPIFHE